MSCSLPHTCAPCAGSCGPGWGTPLQREPQRHQGRWTLPTSAKSAPAGVSGALSHHCCPQPHWQPWWDSDTPAGGITRDSSAGRRWERRQGRSQLAEDQALVVGRHVHLEARSRGSGGHTGSGSSPGPSTLPSSPGAARWPRPAPAAAPCPAAPRRDCCGREARVTLGDTAPGQPHPPGHPRLGAALRRGLS